MSAQSAVSGHKSPDVAADAGDEAPATPEPTAGIAPNASKSAEGGGAGTTSEAAHGEGHYVPATPEKPNDGDVEGSMGDQAGVSDEEAAADTAVDAAGPRSESPGSPIAPSLQEYSDGGGDDASAENRVDLHGADSAPADDVASRGEEAESGPLWAHTSGEDTEASSGGGVAGGQEAAATGDTEVPDHDASEQEAGQGEGVEAGELYLGDEEAGHAQEEEEDLVDRGQGERGEQSSEGEAGQQEHEEGEERLEGEEAEQQQGQEAWEEGGQGSEEADPAAADADPAVSTADPGGAFVADGAARRRDSSVVSASQYERTPQELLQSPPPLSEKELRTAEVFGDTCRALLLQCSIPALCGELHKKGGASLNIRALKRWRRRWFRFDQGSLAYWEHRESCDSGRKPKGIIPVLGCDIENVKIKGVPSPYVFEARQDAGRVSQLVADDKDSLSMWTRALKNVNATMRGANQGMSVERAKALHGELEDLGILPVSVDALSDRYGWDFTQLGPQPLPTVPVEAKADPALVPTDGGRAGRFKGARRTSVVLPVRGSIRMGAEEDASDAEDEPAEAEPEEERPCASCGAKHYPGARFCSMCGASLLAAPPAPAAAAAAAGAAGPPPVEPGSGGNEEDGEDLMDDVSL